MEAIGSYRSLCRSSIPAYLTLLCTYLKFHSPRITPPWRPVLSIKPPLVKNTLFRPPLKMRATSRLLQACRITLFTRENCGLCSQARSVLSKVWDKRPFVFIEVDIIKDESRAWRDLYEFDVPVVSSNERQGEDGCNFLCFGSSCSNRSTSASRRVHRKTRLCLEKPSS